MNVKDFTYLLQHPDKVVAPEQTIQLEEVLAEYPYFQAARALHLKGLKNLNSFKYNNVLKVAAAYTTDRDILFDYITSQDFLQNAIADSILGKTAPLADIETQSEEVVPQSKGNAKLVEATEERPLPQTLGDADKILDPDLFISKNPPLVKTISQDQKEEASNLALGEPLPFTKKEKYSFGQWLQLTSHKAIKRPDQNEHGTEREPIDFPLEESVLKNKKFELIDKFIADKPKIVPVAHPEKIDIKASIKFDKNELMTETLARVYLEQKKFKKAIQAYKILSLKYPEKSGFFADRIKSVEKIQKDNT
tara:strand:+ start:1538 stop:2458 length:921 start_codon:yes stop_codon:yes gene_type:complete